MFGAVEATVYDLNPRYYIHPEGTVVRGLGTLLAGWLAAGSLLAGRSHHIPPSIDQLPSRNYTVLDGLPSDKITCVVQDSRGYMWFCTGEGLSRFDGYKFTSYGTEQGLPHQVVNDILESREGDYWVATPRGLCRFDPQRRDPRSPLFRCYRPYEPYGSVSALFQDRAGRIWCGTYDGLYRLKMSPGHDPAFEYIELGMPRTKGDPRLVTSFLEDRRGTLWVGSGVGLYRYSGAGAVERFGSKQGLPENFVHDLAEDSEGRIWAAFDGLYRLDEEPRADRYVVEHHYSTSDGLRSTYMLSLLKAADGTLWAGTRAGGLSRFIPGPSGAGRFETVVPVPGANPAGVESLGQDREGNLWIGSGGQGVIKIAHTGFTIFPVAVRSLFTSTTGNACATGSSDVHEELLFLGCLEGNRFRWIEPWHPKDLGWGWLQLDFQDHTGEWWIATGEGLYRFPKVARFEELERTPPKAVYRMRDGLPGDDVFRLFEDSRGDIWISIVSSRPRGGPPTGSGLVRWDRATERIHQFPEMGDLRWGVPLAFAEDHSGDIWIGISDRLVRFRNGRFSVFGSADGLPLSDIDALHADSIGRIWIGTVSAGLLRLDSPAEDHPRFMAYSTRDGLSSNGVAAITEDQAARIYAVSRRGIDRLELTGSRLRVVRHYTEADGLPNSNLDEGWCDREGILWFAGRGFLARLVPQREPPPIVPTVRVSALRINGTQYTVSELGETEVKDLRLRPGQNNLQLDFAAISFAAGQSLRYQYRLEGADHDWSPPAEQRTVNYANLSPGEYTFLVRALTADGVSTRPATVAFTILSPVWRRWWFLSTAAITFAALIYSLYRYRLAQLLAVERIRTRIAADLHDDIGASLSQIAILSEMAHSKIDDDPRAAEPLSEIASISGELVDTMGDIVWAINPKHDRLSNLEHRMRRFASDVLSARDIDLEWRGATGYEDIRVSADIRRQVFLIFKEAVNNIARHSGSNRAGVDFAVIEDALELHVTDDGRGFNPSAASGNGLVNIRKRAADLGGAVTLESAPKQGTSLMLRVPLAARTWWGSKHPYRL